MSDARIYLNGINALTGEYLVPPLTPAEAITFAGQTKPTPEKASWLGRLVSLLTGRFCRYFGPPAHVKPEDPSQAGWAVVFTPDTPEGVRKALQPLIEHRAGQIPPDRHKVLTYTPGQTRGQWLAQHGVSSADVEPTLVPYYLLLIGGPEAIPFEVQFEVDLDYAVGRLAFDRAEDYGRYAEAVVAYETDPAVANAREVVYWGTQHEADPATQLSSAALVRPLFEGVPAQGDTAPYLPIAGMTGFRSRCLVGDGEATKARLLELLHARGKALPSFLFTASHGVGGWPKGDARERPGNGALLCQDWPGFGRIKPEHYLTGAEVGPDAQLRGLVAFVFACYGAGTPRYDNFLRKPGAGPVEIAERPFVSALAQRLLTGGALAVIGHVERAWGYSIQPPGVGPQLLPFRNLLFRVLIGQPVGHATMDFSQRYATESVALLNKLSPAAPGAQRPTDQDLAWTWVQRNDAQNYVVLGDPAVRLRTANLK
jgi:hypothetical protein